MGSAGVVLVLAARSGRAARRERAIFESLRLRARPTDGALPRYGIIVQSSKARRGGAILTCDNQGASPYVVRAFGRDNIGGIAVLDQLHEQEVHPRVDTRGPECDRDVAGYVRFITGERERTIWQVAA